MGEELAGMRGVVEQLQHALTLSEEEPVRPRKRDALLASIESLRWVRVNVPSPVRFAFHKLWLSAQSPSSEAARARKDVRQAEQILEVLLADRPGDVAAAWGAAASRGGLSRDIRRGLKRLDSATRSGVELVIAE